MLLVANFVSTQHSGRLIDLLHLGADGELKERCWRKMFRLFIRVLVDMFGMPRALATKLVHESVAVMNINPLDGKGNWSSSSSTRRDYLGAWGRTDDYMQDVVCWTWLMNASS